MIAIMIVVVVFTVAGFAFNSLNWYMKWELSQVELNSFVYIITIYYYKLSNACGRLAN